MTATPSRADIDLTHALREAGSRLGVEIYDHVVVGKAETRSLRALGLL